jgi:hypothetical protein
MTALEVIEEIKHLPKEELQKVLEFTCRITQNPRLSPEELGELAKRMVRTEDTAEADHLEQQLIRGFYGTESHA